MSFPRATPQSRRAFLQSLAATAVAATLGAGILDAVSGAQPAAAAPAPRALLAPPERMVLQADGTWTVLPPGIARTTPVRAMFRRAYAPRVRRTVYVAGTGSWSGDGTQSRPFREISQAIAQAEPGDLVLVADGEYSYTQVVGFHGRPGAWLTIMSAGERAKPVITVPPPCDNFVNIIDSSYVAIYGMTVVGHQDNPNTNGSGMSVYGDSHHIALWSNTIHDFPGGGINCFEVDGSHDVCEFAFNRIYRTSRYSPSNTSGISLYASKDLTGGTGWADGNGYRIVGNYVFDIECTVPFTPGGMDFITDGNGISIDCLETTHGYTKPVLIAGNIITGCGGRAVHVYNSVNVTATTNVAVGNLRTDSPAINGSAELDGTTDGSVRFHDNVIWSSRPGNRLTDATSTWDQNTFLTATPRTATASVLPGSAAGTVEPVGRRLRAARVQSVVISGGTVADFRPVS